MPCNVQAESCELFLQVPSYPCGHKKFCENDGICVEYSNELCK